MTDRRRATDPGPRSDDFKIGCVVGALSGVVGIFVATAALLILRPEWISREGDQTGTIVAGLAGGWAVALIAAVIAGLVLVAQMLGLERVRGRAPTRLNVVLIFIGPAVVAAITLWIAASVNR